ncbi:phosphonate C-P lyase system protein PhnH [Metabacillus malikii]|uniref:Alpha-D-ribose 1-methylphosphonate 5-triphosphate synthase subunit PhnH n=1 Tax=Metabacillus malikii TaxID=1504265 RepID=A0ABT9ZKB5_9BACI|nr:phosphonate C-P lyase system protein PhnH [Metabacillus malikii]MDQ0232737.1 alpha-D-ribose 1-methylphosphonate 5-triphosphate synthase subunit PhnH [Metabacillus malikii]
MKLDFVHDLQAVYRKMVDSTSRPGQLSSLAREAELYVADNEAVCNPSLFIIAHTLLDQEVTFKVISAQESLITTMINELTYARPADTKDADYVFIVGDAETGSLQEAISSANPGTLSDPHQSATIIAEVDKLAINGPLTLTGPGIQTSVSVTVSTPEHWVNSRQEKNKEYPLGIDLMFIDASHQLLSLPRTTQITELG